LTTTLSTRELILDTASELIAREGIGKLTLDRVARDAGISKGGLLYHYSTKEQLIVDLMGSLVARFDQKLANAGREVACSGKHTRAFVEATLGAGSGALAVLMAALSSDPALLDPLRQQYRTWQNTLVHDGIDPVRATVARLAAEGLWFSEALGLAPPAPEQRQHIIREILTLVEKGGPMRESIANFQDAAPAFLLEMPEANRAELQSLSVQAARAALLSADALQRLQHRDGYWLGDLTADTTLESDYVLLTLWLYPPSADGWHPPQRARIDKALATILDRQLADGGWNIYPGGPSEVNASARAYTALKIGGFSPDHPSMQRARRRVLALGGLQAANSYTKINLSMVGLFPKQYAPTVPPELVLIPGNLLYEMSSWTRAIIVPLSIVQASGVQSKAPGGMTVEELYLPGKKLVAPKKDRISAVFLQADKVLKLWERRGLKDVRAKAIRECEKWMLDHLRFSEGVGAIYPSMMYTIMAMDALGYDRDHPDLLEAIQQFDRLILETGDRLEFQPCFSPVWDTAIAMFALGELGAATPERMRVAADWLLDREIRRKGDWSVKRPDLAPGGWAFEFMNDFYPDIDDTAMVLLALEHAQASDPDRQKRVERRAIQWLLGMQSSDGGWAAFDVDNNWQLLNKVPFADHNAMLDPTCPDITGRVLEALARRGLDREHPAISSAVNYLLTHQKEDGSWYGRWGVNYLYGTFLALRGLHAAGTPGSHPAVTKAAAWIRETQNSDGGWGESCAGYDAHRFVGASSTASQTAWALLGLGAAGDRGSEAVRRGVGWLLDRQKSDGTWDEEQATGTGFPNVFYLNYHLYRHYFPILALASIAPPVTRS
jgi:squalene-hopene/tetraprenyl-beta-curcumene cyclase